MAEMNEMADDDFGLSLMMLQGYCELGKEVMEQLKERLEQEKAKLQELQKRINEKNEQELGK